MYAELKRIQDTLVKAKEVIGVGDLNGRLPQASDAKAVDEALAAVGLLIASQDTHNARLIGALCEAKASLRAADVMIDGVQSVLVKRVGS